MARSSASRWTQPTSEAPCVWHLDFMNIFIAKCEAQWSLSWACECGLLNMITCWDGSIASPA
jgi:hypothetical protein